MFGYKREKTRESGEKCIITGFMIRQILLEEDEMGGALVRGSEGKLLLLLLLLTAIGLSPCGSGYFTRTQI